MAEYNQLLAQRYNKLATALLGLEEAPGIGSVGPELLPVVVMQGDRMEDGRLRGERHCCGVVSATAGAATLVHVALTVPVGSGMIATLTDIYVASGAGDQLLLAEKGDAVPLATPEFGFLQDPRGQPNPSSAVAGRLSSVVLAAGALTPFAVLSLQAGVELHHWSKQGALYVVAPGRGLILRNATVTAAVNLVLRWTERAARPEEL